ncbi:MAG: LemA family protein [Bacteroidales bacterium]|nr:LemA family protein [Bacteroidales bacterium]
MKKGLSTTAILLILAVVVIAWGVKAYNNLVSGEETVSTAWAQVENVYQRRADLIPNLVATVKGYAAHEQSTFEAVTQARANATGMTVDASNLTPEQIAEFQKAQGQLSTALGRLIAISENYPELKANENFKDLQAQLEGTENRISTERMKFNEAAKKFNVSVRRFPANIIAGIFGFQTKGYFEAAEGASTAPKVEF